MKKNFLFFCFCLLSSISFSDCFEDCQQFKSSQLSVIQSLYEDVLLQDGLIGQCYTNLYTAQSQLQTVHGSNQYVDNAEIELVGLQSSLTSVRYYNGQIRMLTSEANTLLQTLDCFSSSSNSNCCPDLSTIESRLFDIFNELVLIYQKPSSNYGQLQEIRELVNYISGYYEFLVWDTGDIKDDVSSILTLFEPFSDSHNGVLPLLRQIADSVSNQVATVGFSVTNDFTIIVSNSTDVSSILSRIDTVNENLSNIRSSIDSLTNYISEITNHLSYTNFLLEHGFYNSTNLLLTATNLLSEIRDRFYITVQDENGLSQEIYEPYHFQTSSGQYYSNYGPWYTYTGSSIAALLQSFNWTLGEETTSLNNYQYNFQKRLFPVLTNTVGFIHRDQTNYFSFFRGEIGVQGVLSDWQSQQVSGSYHDFLTNHYLTVVTGGPLSGNQSSKTNWFSRIETLLAALVFTDSVTTNTVDKDAGREERNQLETSYDNVNQSASTFSETFSQTSESMVDLYRSYFQMFDNAAMPSHVSLMHLEGDSGEDIEIYFQSDVISSLVEACRLVSTFCWASVGIFLLYKFLVWAARCIVVTCQFIYRVISSVFK